MIEEKICQSCGMPMEATEHFGINADHTPNEEYCCFCFQNGTFTDSFTLDQFVQDSIENNDLTDSAKEYCQTNDELRLRELVRIQELKRWRSHQNTHQEYYKAVNYALDYINEHLTESIQLSDIASVANISEFHFHRIFKAIINESPGDYIQRLRLEKAAFKLQTTSLSLTDIAEQTGYQTPQALSKAFKKRYNISPAAFRKTPTELKMPINKPVTKDFIEPEIKKIAPKKVIYKRVINPFSNKNAFVKAWEKLIGFMKVNGIPDDKHEYLCVSRDVSPLTNPQACRIYACIHTDDLIKPKGEFGIQTIDGGTYAVFTHKGSYDDIRHLYCNIYRYWIPNSNYQLRDSLHFEKYMNNPEEVSREELITEVYIPVTLI